MPVSARRRHSLTSSQVGRGCRTISGPGNRSNTNSAGGEAQKLFCSFVSGYYYWDSLRGDARFEEERHLVCAERMM